ncbi:MAG: hypothetical protein U0703_08210 [Anaerolineae bacterium]
MTRGQRKWLTSAHSRSDPSDSRVLFELDQLDKHVGRAPAERLARLEQYAEQVDACATI